VGTEAPDLKRATVRVAEILRVTTSDSSKYKKSQLDGTGRNSSTRRFGLVGPRGSQLQCRLMKTLFQVLVICCGCNKGE
jgi:hypothetical protein